MQRIVLIMRRTDAVATRRAVQDPAANLRDALSRV